MLDSRTEKTTFSKIASSNEAMKFLSPRNKEIEKIGKKMQSL